MVSVKNTPNWKLVTECEKLASTNFLEAPPAGVTIQVLVGDASTRCYYRIHSPFGPVVLMHMPEPFEESNFPYLDNYELFRTAGLSLAEIYFMKPERGWVFLQDLGDHTYYELNSTWNNQVRAHYFLESVNQARQIATIQPRSTLTFDTEKLVWELEYFKRNFLERFRRIELSENEAQTLAAFSYRLASELASEPRFFCHRDYHSRNLMVHKDQIYIVDFQDARLGPVTYDLASLCYDSYIQHSPGLIAQLEGIFFTYHPSARVQRYEYPRMCLQRNLKALGTFGYQASQMGREFYVQFVDRTLGYIRHHFDKLPEYAEMRQILSNHLPELR